MTAKLSTITCIEDLRVVAKRRVPRMFYDYADSGAWTEGTYRANESDFQKIKLRQRVAVNMEGRSLRTTLAGHDVAMPLAIAPTGLTGMQHADGEILAAKAAAEFGVPFTLSTMSICSLEDVAAATGKPFWFQLYVMRDREFVGNLIDRAKAAGCSALVLTLDLQILGQRHKDIKNGLSTPPKPTLRNLINLATKPRWCMGMLGTKRRTFGNIVGHAKGVSDLSSLSSWTAEQFDPRLSWDDVEWIKQRWGGKLILKGILDVEDAQLAANSGADALIVSNHGGRQLDGAMSSIAAVPSIADAVGSKIEVWMDGGVRSGQDILKAVALGARGAMIGRAFLYGLGAYGQDGVRRVLEILYKEMDTTMALCAAARSCRATAASCCRAPIRSEAGRARLSVVAFPAVCSSFQADPLRSHDDEQEARRPRPPGQGVAAAGRRGHGRPAPGSRPGPAEDAVRGHEWRRHGRSLCEARVSGFRARPGRADRSGAGHVGRGAGPRPGAEGQARHAPDVPGRRRHGAGRRRRPVPAAQGRSCAARAVPHRRPARPQGGGPERRHDRAGLQHPPVRPAGLGAAHVLDGPGRPRYKGKVVMQSAAASTFGLHAFLMFNRIQGGTDADTNPGFRAWPGSVGANVREYLPDSARLGELIEADEAALFPLSPPPSCA